MGSGKTTLGREVARGSGGAFVDLDGEIEARAGAAIAELFASRGRVRLPRARGGGRPRTCSARRSRSVVALGGGAVLSERTRELLAERALHGPARRRAGDGLGARRAGRDRPLARTRTRSTRSTASASRSTRRSRTRARATSTGSCSPPPASTSRPARSTSSASSCRATGPVELVADAHVVGDPRRSARRSRSAPATSRCTRCRRARRRRRPPSLERLWSALPDRPGRTRRRARRRLDDRRRRASRPRRTCAASRGRPCRRRSSARSTPAIGGKTAIDLPGGEERRRRVPLAGAGRLRPGAPRRRCPRPSGGTGSPRSSRRGSSRASRSGSCPSPSRCARAPRSRRPSACADPHDRGPRNQLNLGHTFAHALEAAAGYALPHGRAVALGLLAALRLSGLDDEVATVRGRARARAGARSTATPPGRRSRRDKKAVARPPRLVLLERAGQPRWGVERPRGRRPRRARRA